MAARAGVEPTILRLKAIDSTKMPPCNMAMLYICGLMHRNVVMVATVS